MKRYTGLIGVAAALAIVTSASTASAGAAYADIYRNLRTSMVVFRDFTQGAKQSVAKGDRGEAMLKCVAAVRLIWKYIKGPSLVPYKADLVAYDAVCMPLYKGRKPDPAGFDAVVAQYKDQITEYGFALAFEPYGKARRPLGGASVSYYDQHKRMVDAAMISPKARAYAIEFVGKLPAPGVLLGYLSTHKSRDFDELPGHLVSIVAGKYAAAQQLKKTGIARIIRETDVLINRLRPTMGVGGMQQQVDDATKWIILLRTAAPKHPKIAEYDAAIKKVRDAVIKRANAQLAKRRMPASTYKGPGKKQILRFVRATYKASYGKYDKVIRVVINTYNWNVPRREIYKKNKRWYWRETSKLSPITVAVEQKKSKGKKTYELFQITLFRQRTRGGSWSKPYMVGRTIALGSILKRNVKK